MSGALIRAEQWRRRFVAVALAWLAFETIGGLSVYLLPFSVLNQWLVLGHTAAGVLGLAPVLAYLWRHFGA